ncbi:HTH DNA binding domain protein [Candidatus Bilamarchaeum dharawalense]|uniref:HTH DNA binding domain protein n=1 Tax=Candidatus Bilamarchaeum dharawalense TaxID=2885759 RepID=A0A5E4LSZ3_9ARCH|nr:HTH DNA binding domain protein [Candidatus Bilamarchaeum dharawalense]
MSEKTQPLIVELEQIHDCTSIAVTDKLKDVKIKWLATIGQDEKTITNLFEVDTSHLRTVVDLWKRQTKVKEVSIILIGPHKSQLSIRQSKDLATAPALAKTKTMWIEPTYTEAGVDYVTMLAPNFKNLKDFMELVKEHGYDLKIKSKRYLEPSQAVSLDSFRTSGFSKLKFASELLTDRQMEVFDLACRYGYYEEPKKISIEELSQKLGISPSTCAELLRKAEKKLLPVLNDILRVMR